jgi:hypothetical protein
MIRLQWNETGHDPNTGSIIKKSCKKQAQNGHRRNIAGQTPPGLDKKRILC